MEQDYSGWRLLPFVSIKSEMIRTIEQFDSAIKNGETGVAVEGKNELVFHKGDVAVAGTCFDIDGTDFALSLLKRFAGQKVSTGYISAGSTDYETIGQKLVSFSAGVSSEKIKSLPVGVQKFSGALASDYGKQFAALMISVIPIIIFYGIFRKQITKGVAAGAVKG